MTAAQKHLVHKIKPSRLVRIMNDPEKSASAVSLIYTSDQQTPGIRRKPYGKKFHYYEEGVRIKDSQKIKRFESLAIPPAWEDVWICALENGHLQATGVDGKKRKQYRYHPLWTALRNHTKFYRMISFGHALPKLRLAMEKDLSRPKHDQRKVLALVVSLMERTGIRIGNQAYEKLYGSFGLTTLKDKHVQIEGGEIRFSFKGKKGIYHDIGIRHRKLANAVKKCRDIPGKELFQYYDAEGKRQSIDSGLVNSYIKEHTGDDFTAKDFRTWSGTVSALIAIKEIEQTQSNEAYKKKVNLALEKVSQHLGNTPTVCRKYYVHPLVINLYENDSIKKYTDRLDAIEIDDGKSGLTVEEKLVLEILENESPAL